MQNINDLKLRKFGKSGQDQKKYLICVRAERNKELYCIRLVHWAVVHADDQMLATGAVRFQISVNTAHHGITAGFGACTVIAVDGGVVPSSETPIGVRDTPV